MQYRHRLTDELLESKLKAMGAVHIIGPRWCGKTTSANQYAKSAVYMQDQSQKEKYIELSKINPSRLLSGDRPVLIDEWQVAPNLWDQVRFEVDKSDNPGQFILTGSVNINWDEVSHTGTGRMAELRMNTMSLFESGESDGSVSLSDLFSGKEITNGESNLELRDVAEIIIRGGWPESIGKESDISYEMIESYCISLEKKDMSAVDGIQRDSSKVNAIMRSLSRNISTSVSKSTILEDLNESGNSMNINTLDSYLSALRKLYVLDELRSWSPQMRSKTAIRKTPVIEFADPAIAAYYLGASADGLLDDPETFGFLFESLVIRDLRVYAETLHGNVYRYHDRNDLEADAIIRLKNGKWGAIEIKLGNCHVEKAAENLKKLADKTKNAPSFLAVIVPTGYAYTRPDGINVVPIGCLRN